MPELVIIDPSWAASQQAVLHAVPFPQTPQRYCPHRLRVLPRRPPGAAPRGRPPPTSPAARLARLRMGSPARGSAAHL